MARVFYREPTYEKHVNAETSRLHPCQATYEVLASDIERAKELALEEFRRAAVQSSSGWTRMVVRVECQAIDDNVICEISPE